MRMFQNEMLFMGAPRGEKSLLLTFMNSVSSLRAEALGATHWPHFPTWPGHMHKTPAMARSTWSLPALHPDTVRQCHTMFFFLETHTATRTGFPIPKHSAFCC